MPETEVLQQRTSLGVQRIIGHVKGDATGPTVIFFGGVHGNEPAGVRALQQTFENLRENNRPFHGELIGLAGNLTALNRAQRFVEEDLNRIWFPQRLRRLLDPTADKSVEEQEMLLLNQRILDILKTASPPFYFIDLHTTSGDTEPFLVVNDSLLNRRFTQNYPLPIILGIEEYLTGALLSYMNEMGFVAFGFESGQHKDPQAVVNARNFIEYTLGLTGFYLMQRGELAQVKKRLARAGHAPQRFYEIYYQHLIKEGAHFRMLPGFDNFQAVPKGISIAQNGSGTIITDKPRQLFMPLYQDKGYEGFYYIRSIPKFFLWLSKYLRMLKVDGFLARLPGVNWASPKREALYVNKRIARFFVKSFFHLLGYRTRKMDATHLILKNRESNSRHKEYKGTPWY